YAPSGRPASASVRQLVSGSTGTSTDVSPSASTRSGSSGADQTSCPTPTTRPALSQTSVNGVRVVSTTSPSVSVNVSVTSDGARLSPSVPAHRSRLSRTPGTRGPPGIADAGAPHSWAVPASHSGWYPSRMSTAGGSCAGTGTSGTSRATGSLTTICCSVSVPYGMTAYTS